MPKYKWSTPDETWLDPAAGLGNFHAVVVERLMTNNIPYKHIIEKQLYFIELNPESCRLIKEIFDPNQEYNLNLVCADALDPKHSGWDDVGYMWDDDDKESRKTRHATLENKEKNVKAGRCIMGRPLDI